MNIQELTPDNFDDLTSAEHTNLLVIDFYGPNCPNCEIFAAAAPSLLKELEGDPVTILKCDAYNHPELARKFALFGVPTFILMYKGKVLGKMSQYRGFDFWLSVVREHLPEHGKKTP